MTHILAIANHKGGVGKTSLVQNLAAALSETDSHSVLLVDLDPQGSLTLSCGVDPRGRQPIYDLLFNRKLSAEAVFVRQDESNQLPPATSTSRARRSIWRPTYSRAGLPFAIA